MNPYNRFSLFSSSVTAALILAVLAMSGPAILKAVNQSGANLTNLGVFAVAAVTVMVVFWMAFTEVILPSLFRLDWVRKMILGRYYIEGTWLQAEKGGETAHIAVIDIQPNGKSFTFSGYALDENMDVNSNVLLELSKFDWPFLTFKYRNSLSDGSDGQRDGVGEVQFEMNRAAARRYNGYSQYIKADVRTRLEGAKLTKGSQVRRLRTLEGREEIVDQYWDLFFGRQERRMNKTADLSPVSAPVAEDRPAERQTEEPKAAPIAAAPVKASKEPATESMDDDLLVLDRPVTETDERRTGDAERPTDLEEHVIPRRRVSDWKADEAEEAGNAPDLSDDEIEPAEAGLQKAEADAKPAGGDEVKSSDTKPAGARQADQKRVFDARHVL